MAFVVFASVLPPVWMLFKFHYPFRLHPFHVFCEINAVCVAIVDQLVPVFALLLDWTFYKVSKYQANQDRNDSNDTEPCSYAS